MKVIKLSKTTKRIVYGSYADKFDLDYTQSLTELKKDVEFALMFFTEEEKLLRNKNKHIFVYEGGNHIDIVEDGVGSLGWLMVEDHYVRE